MTRLFRRFEDSLRTVGQHNFSFVDLEGNEVARVSSSFPNSDAVSLRVASSAQDTRADSKTRVFLTPLLLDS